MTIDPGHDGGNASDPAFIDAPIDGGGFTESCDTAGTTTASGYTEHAFNFDVALRLASLLQAGGATVVLTRYTDTGVGPCVNVRAAIGNDDGSDAAISIHGDGGPVSGSGASPSMSPSRSSARSATTWPSWRRRTSSATTCATSSWPPPASRCRTTRAPTASTPVTTSVGSTSPRSPKC